MNAFQLILTCILVFSLLTFSVLFGHIPALKHSPIGWLNHFITTLLPHVLARIDQVICRGRMTHYVRRKHERIMYQRHPSVLIMYLVLFLGGVYIFLTRLFLTLPLLHQVLVPFLIGLPLTFLYLAASTEPGYITRQTHAKYMQKYEFDGVLYRRGHECSTCLHEKPARSKHCSLCNACIAKHDHHCIWINSCVGERNMKWFLAFLASNTTTFTYAAVILFQHFSHDELASRISEESGTADLKWWHTWLVLLKKDTLLGGLFLFILLCDAMVTAFLVYHSYLIFSGVTTNETLKFEDIREAIGAREVDIYRTSPGRYKLDVAGHADAVAWHELDNIYDQGWKKNLQSIIAE